MPFALAALALLWALMLVAGTGGADQAIHLALYAGGNPALVAGARAITTLGSGAILLPATALGALALALRRDLRGSALLLVITLTGRLLVELQKGWIGRPRPADREQLDAVASFAFPSGHAANTTMVAFGLALLVAPRRWRPAALALAAGLAFAVGLSRIMLGVHWPSDVAAGWAFGLAWTLLLVRLCGRPATDCSPASPPQARD
jgi:undecaprenyl-diphosphatase